jgi:hypothetical protein
VAPRCPLLTDDSIHHVMRPVGDRPSAERLLNLRVEPLLRRDPPLDDPQVDLAQHGRPLQRLEFGQRNAGVVAVHRDQKHPAGVPVQPMCPLQELHPAHLGQTQIRGDQCYFTAVAREPLERREARFRRARRHHPVVQPEAPHQRCLGRRPGLLIGVNDEQHRMTPVGPKGRFMGRCHVCALRNAIAGSSDY